MFGFQRMRDFSGYQNQNVLIFFNDQMVRKNHVPAKPTGWSQFWKNHVSAKLTELGLAWKTAQCRYGGWRLHSQHAQHAPSCSCFYSLYSQLVLVQSSHSFIDSVTSVLFSTKDLRNTGGCYGTCYLICKPWNEEIFPSWRVGITLVSNATFISFSVRFRCTYKQVSFRQIYLVWSCSGGNTYCRQVATYLIAQPTDSRNNIFFFFMLVQYSGVLKCDCEQQNYPKPQGPSRKKVLSI